MSLTSRRRLVLAALLARLEAITANDAAYETDAGQAVCIGDPQPLGEHDPSQAIAVIIGDDDPQPQTAGAFLVSTPIEIVALREVDPTDPWLPVEAVLADIKRAVEQSDQSFGGLVSRITRGTTRALPRDPGATTAAVSITYVLTWKEAWGNP